MLYHKNNDETIEKCYETFGKISASYLQRKLGISYYDAIKLINQFDKIELNKRVLVR